MRKTVYRIVIVTALLLVAVYILVSNRERNQEEAAIITQKNKAVSVKVDTVTLRKPDIIYKSNGTFESVQQLVVAPETSGTIQKILVKEGDTVVKGQTLAYLKKDQATVTHQNATATYQNALENYNRYQQSYKTGGVTKEQLEHVQLELENAKAALNKAALQVEDTHIKATINGIINKKYIEPGAVVTTTSTLFEIVDISYLKLQLSVPEMQVAQIHLGQKVYIQSSVYPDTTLTGDVSFIAAKANSSLNFPVQVTLKNNRSYPLRAGMYATAIFTPDKKNIQPVKMISRDAFMEGLGSSQVFVVKNHQAYLQNVLTGRNFNDNVEILKGLEAGDIIVTSGQINLEDQSTIQIIP